MTKMCPELIAPDTKSSAEKRMFEVIREQLGPEWTALHSVGIANHPRQPWAEADFVLVGPPGVFCLEVKGGRVGRCGGKWAFTNAKGETTYKKRGPWEQGGGASGALRNHLVARIPGLRDAAVAYGVVMPDITFRIVGPDIDLDVLYDERDKGHSFKTYMRRLATYWHRTLQERLGRSIRQLSEQDRAAIVDELRKDFDLRPSLCTRMGLVNDELLSLTRKQYRVLDGLVDNDRVIVTGAAGTGKTLLAVEEASRRGRQGGKVFLCCFNKQLAGVLKTATADVPNVDVFHLHGFMAMKMAEAGLRDRVPSVPLAEQMSRYYPALCIEALFELDEVGTYDVLVVDEAQDLLTDACLEVFDALLEGGLREGNWRIFHDPYQNIYRFNDHNPDEAAGAVERLRKYHPTTFKLTDNCRNTAPIGVAASLVGRATWDCNLNVEGPKVEYIWYRDRAHQRREISACINRWLSGGLKPEVESHGVV